MLKVTSHFHSSGKQQYFYHVQSRPQAERHGDFIRQMKQCWATLKSEENLWVGTWCKHSTH